jgi:uncharacterized protein (DUF427 family)
MGLSWQQGPLSQHRAGQFLTPEPLPERLLFAEPLRRRMRVRLGGEWIADSEDVVLLHEPGRYPVAYFPRESVADGVLAASGHVTRHPELGDTAWFSVTAGPATDGTATAGATTASRGAWEFRDPPDYAKILRGRVAFAWRAMDAFYEEDERILGHAADAYHRIDIRATSRHLVVTAGGQVVADTRAPLALYESGFAPRWYVPRADVRTERLTPAAGQTFCPYKGICSYYDVDGGSRAAWSYEDAYAEVDRVRGYLSFEPDRVEVHLDGTRLHLEPGQTVIPHGVDRGLDIDEISTRPGRN